MPAATESSAAVVLPSDGAEEENNSETPLVEAAGSEKSKLSEPVALPDSAASAPKSAGMSCCKKFMFTSLCLVGSFVAFIGIGLQVGFVTLEDADEGVSSPPSGKEFSAAGSSSGASSDLPPELAYLQGHIPSTAQEKPEGGVQAEVKAKKTGDVSSTSSANDQDVSTTDAADTASKDESTSDESPAAMNVSVSSDTTITTTTVTEEPHRHLVCKGGSAAVCECLFSCEIFGSRPGQCDSGEKVQLLDALVKQALNSTETACAGMQCITRCSKRLGCYDEKVEGDCRSLQERTEAMKELTEGQPSSSDTCKFECDAEDSTEESSEVLQD